MKTNRVLWLVATGCAVGLGYNASANIAPVAGDSGQWTVDATGFISIKMSTSASYAPITKFGIYELGTLTRVEIFNGAADPVGTSKIVTIDPFTGAVALDGVTAGTFSAPITLGDPFFGFYIDVPKRMGGTWYSEQSQNSDGYDHMLLDQTDAPDVYHLLWEDLRNGGDEDFNDLVVDVVSIPGAAPGPVVVSDGASTLALLGLAFAGIGIFRRRS